MEFIYNYYNQVYYFLIISLLVLSWYFASKSNRINRRYRRSFLSRTELVKQKDHFLSKLKNDKYDKIFLDVGLQDYITSEQVNIIRYAVLFWLILYQGGSLLFDYQGYAPPTILSLFAIFFFFTPTNPLGKFLLSVIRKQYQTKKNYEVYQLYQEIKADYTVKQEHVGNTYHLFMKITPYYEQIRTTMERMMPHLYSYDYDKAWELFEDEIGTPEAKSLSMLMREINNVGIEDSLAVLEKKREEFVNNMYNQYKEYLNRRRQVIFAVVSTGAVFAFLNGFIAFYLWYKDIMASVHNL